MSLIDVWTIGHFAMGLGLAFVTKKLWRVATVLVSWEWFENSDTVPLPWGDPSFFNGCIDVVVALIAFYFARLIVSWSEPFIAARPWIREAVDED